MVHVHAVWAAANRGIDEVTECTELVLVLHVQERTSIRMYVRLKQLILYLRTYSTFRHLNSL